MQRRSLSDTIQRTVFSLAKLCNNTTKVYFISTDNVCPSIVVILKLILVRCVLELTVRHNLHFFYQYRCCLFLFTELWMNEPNHNQFHTCIVTRVITSLLVKVVCTIYSLWLLKPIPRYNISNKKKIWGRQYRQ